MRQRAFSLRDAKRRRKYINKHEREAFQKALILFTKEKGLFFKTIFWTGARISEALNLRIWDIDLSERVIVIQSLKKRGQDHTRDIPVPPELLDELRRHIKQLRTINGVKNPKLFGWSRRTASRYIEKLMSAAHIYGPMACARGIRHGYAVNALLKGAPLTTVQKWMGHADIATTAIYLNVVGEEERKIAART